MLLHNGEDLSQALSQLDVRGEFSRALSELATDREGRLRFLPGIEDEQLQQKPDVTRRDR